MFYDQATHLFHTKNFLVLTLYIDANEKGIIATIVSTR